MRADRGAKAVVVEGPEMQQGDTTKPCLPTLSHHHHKRIEAQINSHLAFNTSNMSLGILLPVVRF